LILKAYQDPIEAYFLVCFVTVCIGGLIAAGYDKYSLTKMATSLNSMSYTFLEDKLFAGYYLDTVFADTNVKSGQCKEIPNNAQDYYHE
jgi:hypothetical protein